MGLARFDGLPRLFGGFGVLVLGIIATAVLIAQIIEGTICVRDRDRGTVARAALKTNVATP